MSINMGVVTFSGAQKQGVLMEHFNTHCIAAYTKVKRVVTFDFLKYAYAYYAYLQFNLFDHSD